MDAANMDALSAALGTITTAVIGAAFWLRKMKPTFAKDDLAAKAAEADMGVIERLEKQCDRLAKQNDTLADSLNQFQLQIITLQTENNKLSMENAALREENLSLREEIMDLRKEVTELTKTVMDMQKMPLACFTCQHKRLP